MNIDRQTDSQTNRQTARQTYRQTARQTDTLTDLMLCIHVSYIACRPPLLRLHAPCHPMTASCSPYLQRRVYCTNAGRSSGGTEGAVSLEGCTALRGQ
jgi:hypothetical protein